jgi:ppGpp synthetase/RelA/SpoT-type nucleotidyltranferase
MVWKEERAMKMEPDFEEYLAKHDTEKTEYEHLSEYVLMQCQRYKKRHPTSVRVVFSRQPPVKEWNSIVKKIRLKRIKRPQYRYGDLEDLIGVTVLCAFESDKSSFVRWMRKAFHVVTDDEEAKRDDVMSGHRGLHYIIQARDSDCVSNPNWSGKKCEIQIKTLLEEAFDAKSHDLTYKKGNRVISPELDAQFVNFSQVLRAVDRQSEFLKGLILADEKKIALRRGACVSLYLTKADDLDFGKAHGLQPGSEESVGEALAKIQQLHKQEPSVRLCRLAALFALRHSDELFGVVALGMCSQIADRKVDDANVYLSIATVEWALGSFDAAMAHVLMAVEHAGAPGSETLPENPKSTFVYLYSDWAVMHSGEAREDWDVRARAFAGELRQSTSRASGTRLASTRLSSAPQVPK